MACAKDPSLAGVTVKNYQTIVLSPLLVNRFPKGSGLLLFTAPTQDAKTRLTVHHAI